MYPLWLWQKSLPDRIHQYIFFDVNLNFQYLDNQEISFDKDTFLNQDDVMIIEGHYTSKPKQLNFHQKYMLEGLRWKLVAIRINVVDPTNPS